MTFNEKVRYKMLADRRPLLTLFADKLAVREYVESKVGAGVLTRAPCGDHDTETLARAELPREFAIKPTHASGACILVADLAPPEAEVPESTAGWIEAVVRPDHVSLEPVDRTLRALGLSALLVERVGLIGTCRREFSSRNSSTTPAGCPWTTSSSSSMDAYG